MATFPSVSANGAWSSATSGAYGSRSPRRPPNGESTTANPGFSAIDEPCNEVVVMAGKPRAAASSRWRKVRNDQCSTSTAPDR